jgi:acetylornithine deacetylase
MDTVSVEGMTIPPFDAYIKDGRVWGRGSSDTKNTGACMLWAMIRYKALSRENQHFNAALVFTVDEEIGMTGVRSLCQDHLSNLGFTPVGAIVGEPTSLRPFSAHNGAIRWQVTTQGIACHSADPSKGRSAITDMVRVIEAIESRYIPTLKQTHPMTGKAQCSINLIKGGTQVNIIPASCEVRIDRRVIPGEDQFVASSELRPILDDLERKHPGLKAQDVVLKFSPPLSDANNSRLLAHVGSAIAKLGHNPAPLGAAFATDAGDLDHAGIPCIVIGPGDIAQAHTKDEYIEISQLKQGVEAYLSLLTQAWG